LILDTDDPFTNAKRYIPFYMFAVGFFLSMVTIIKGLKFVLSSHVISFSFLEAVSLATAIGILVALIGMYLLSRITQDASADKNNRFTSVERVFGVLMIFTACAMAFAHGSNDVANAVGPMAAVVSVIKS